MEREIEWYEVLREIQGLGIVPDYYITAFVSRKNKLITDIVIRMWYTKSEMMGAIRHKKL